MRGFSRPTERRGSISFGTCPCSLISTPVIYTHASRNTRKYDAPLPRRNTHTHMHARAHCSLLSFGGAAYPHVDHDGSFLRDGFEIESKSINCSRFQNNTEMERTGSLKCSSTSQSQRTPAQMSSDKPSLIEHDQGYRTLHKVRSLKGPSLP